MHHLSPWLVPLQEAQPVRLRLVCFPYSGGAAHAFHPWAAALPEGIEMLAVEYPGRWSRAREAPLQRLEPLVEGIREALGTVADAPCVFFGHSLGALTAFEVTRALRRHGGRLPLHLVVSGCYAPRLGRKDDLLDPTLADAELGRALVDRYGGLPGGVLADPEVLALILRAVRPDLEIAWSYRYAPEPPLDIAMTALGGLDDPSTAPDEVEHWRQHTVARFESRLFAGRHFFVHDQEAELLGILRDVLGACLARAATR